MRSRSVAVPLVVLVLGCTNVSQVLRERGDDALLAGAHVQAFVNYEEAGRADPSAPRPEGFAEAAPRVAELKLAEADGAELAGTPELAWNRLEWLRTRSWLPAATRTAVEERRARLFGQFAQRALEATRARAESEPEPVFRELHAIARVDVPLLPPESPELRAVFDLRRAAGLAAWEALVKEVRALRVEPALLRAAALAPTLDEAGLSPEPSFQALRDGAIADHLRLADEAGDAHVAARLFHLLSSRRFGGPPQVAEIARLFREARIGFRAVGADGRCGTAAGLVAQGLTTDLAETPRPYGLTIAVEECVDDPVFETAEYEEDCRDVARPVGTRPSPDGAPRVVDERGDPLETSQPGRECRRRPVVVQARVAVTLRGQVRDRDGLVSLPFEGTWTGLADWTVEEGAARPERELAWRAQQDALAQVTAELRERLLDGIVERFERSGAAARAAGRTLEAEDAWAQLMLLDRAPPAAEEWFVQAYSIERAALSGRFQPTLSPLVLPGAPAPDLRWTLAEPGELPPPQDEVPLWSDPRKPHVALRLGAGGQVGLLGLGLEYRPLPHLGFSVGFGVQASGGVTFTTARHLGEGGFYADLHARWGRHPLADGRSPEGLGLGGTVGYDVRAGAFTLKLGVGVAGNVVAGTAPYLSPVGDLAAGVVF